MRMTLCCCRVGAISVLLKKMKNKYASVYVLLSALDEICESDQSISVNHNI